MDWAELIVAAIAGGAFTSLLNYFAGRAKMKADTSKVLADATNTLIPPLVERLDKLEAEVKTLKRLLDRYARRVIYLMSGIETLIKQIMAKGDSPCWQPDEWSADEERGVEE